MGGETIPVGDGFVVLLGLIGSTVLELDAGVFTEGEEIGEEEAVGGLDPVCGGLRFLAARGAGGVAGEWEGHVSAAPVVAAASPFFGSRSVALRGVGVVEEEARVAFECGEDGVVGEDEGGADERAGPV